MARSEATNPFEITNLLDSLRDPIVIVDARRSIAHANPAAAALLGRSRADLEGRPVDDVLDLPKSDVVRASIRALTKDGGSFVCDAVFSPVATSAGPMTAVTIRDLSARDVAARSAPFTSDASEVRETRKPTSTRSNALRGLRILVVDDEAEARELIEIVLTTNGATVCVAATAEDGLSQLSAFRPDVLLSDIGMPGHDGYWLVERVRETNPDLPAVALTAFTRRDDVAKVLGSGFDEHVAKPVDPKVLVDRIASICA